MARFRRSNPSTNEFFEGRHRFEHWYRDNSVYFITARCCEKYPAFESEKAKEIFWDRFTFYTKQARFESWVTSLLNNHYHALGYVADASTLGQMMRKIHGSVAKLVNDLLPERRVPFWGNDDHDNYMDGCIRNRKQLDRAYRYTRDQSVRAGLVRDYLDYPHTKIPVAFSDALIRADQLNVYLPEVPYKRYEK